MKKSNKQQQNKRNPNGIKSGRRGQGLQQNDKIGKSEEPDVEMEDCSSDSNLQNSNQDYDSDDSSNKDDDYDSSSSTATPKQGQVSNKKPRKMVSHKTSVPNHGWKLVQPPNNRFHTVDPNSTNRRIQRQSNNSTSTSSISPVPITCNNKTRITMKFHLNSVDNAVHFVGNVFKGLAAELDSIDSSSCLLPWKINDFSAGTIDKDSDPIKDIRELRKYSFRLLLSLLIN